MSTTSTLPATAPTLMGKAATVFDSLFDEYAGSVALSIIALAMLLLGQSAMGETL